MNKFAEIILPVRIKGTFTYFIPEPLQNESLIGLRVEVPFGRKIYSGIVYYVHNELPAVKNIKQIYEKIDNEPIVSYEVLKFWKWISDYYMCSIGEVMNSALPSYLKLNSETIFYRNSENQIEPNQLSDNAYLIYEALEIQPFIKKEDVEKIIQTKHIYKYINELIQHKAIVVEENLLEKYTPKLSNIVYLHVSIRQNENHFEDVFKKLNKSPAQEKLFLTFLHLSQSSNKIEQKQLLKASDTNSSTLKSLVDKNILEIKKIQTDRIYYDEASMEIFTLNEEQQHVADTILNQPDQTHLIHGITGSGKTFIYLYLIQEMIKQGKQCLFLVPEISLTSQFINKVLKYVGNDLVVYHSKYSNNERVEIYNKVKSNQASVVLGARSSLFLPFQNLGLIIVDEEHERSYKQQDPAPRYHARDTAIVLANILKTRIVLGSATPSFESFYNVEQGKFQYHIINSRYEKTTLPAVQLIDVKKEQKENIQIELFSTVTLEKIQQTLKDNKQIIIFQNRRGFAPLLICENCGNVPTCTQCDVSLTYHKLLEELKCHYCNSVYPKLILCKSCGSPKIKFLNFGTEQIEEQIVAKFPYARIQRIDQDTMRKKQMLEKTIEAFENKKIDIIIGTQMIAKGLHFENVQLIVVVNADNLISFPDFRASENAFQLLEQVCGRAGRKHDNAEMLVQTFDTNQHLLTQVQKHDYTQFVKNEMQERKEFNFPPFVRIIKIIFKDKNENLVNTVSNFFFTKLHEANIIKVSPPITPSISKIKNKYIKEIVLKIHTVQNQNKSLKAELYNLAEHMRAIKGYSSVYIYFDVDTY